MNEPVVAPALETIEYRIILSAEALEAPLRRRRCRPFQSRLA